MVKKINRSYLAFAYFFLIVIIVLILINKDFSIFQTKSKTANHNPDIEFIYQIEKKVIITTTPDFKYGYDIMQIGVIQHLDRNYTCDYIPKELNYSTLFQGIH